MAFQNYDAWRLGIFTATHMLRRNKNARRLSSHLRCSSPQSPHVGRARHDDFFIRTEPGAPRPPRIRTGWRLALGHHRSSLNGKWLQADRIQRAHLYRRRHGPTRRRSSVGLDRGKRRELTRAVRAVARSLSFRIQMQYSYHPATRDRSKVTVTGAVNRQSLPNDGRHIQRDKSDSRSEPACARRMDPCVLPEPAILVAHAELSAGYSVASGCKRLRLHDIAARREVVTSRQ